MPVTKKILGHWWSDKVLCLRAVLLKLQRPSTSPGGFVKTPAAHRTCSFRLGGGRGSPGGADAAGLGTASEEPLPSNDQRGW